MEDNNNEKKLRAPISFGDFGITEMLQPFIEFPLVMATDMRGMMTEGLRMPNMDIVDNGDSFTVKADMPGVEKKNIKLKVTKEKLMIKAERNEEKETTGKNYYSKERASTGYYREIALPEEVRSDTAKAKYADGTLIVDIKKTNPRPVHLGKEIKVE